MHSKNMFYILAISFFAYFILGLPDGAFGIALTTMMGDMNMLLELAAIITTVQLGLYTFVSSQMGYIAKRIKLQNIVFVGTVLATIGLFGVAAAPNFNVLVAMFAIVGIGLGLIDSSLNVYMSRSDSARYVTWMHALWGLGASVTPAAMSQIILHFGWRIGYNSIAVIYAFVAVLVLFSIFKKIWDASEPKQKIENFETKKNYLSKKRHQFMALVICLLQGGIEFSIIFWMPSIFLESRGLSIDTVGILTAAYFGFLTLGRFVAGYIASKAANITIIRAGLALAIAGSTVLMFTNSLVGVALLGLGIAPILPCIFHDTSNLFSPKIVTRLVGQEVASFGIGGAIIAPLVWQIIGYFSLEMFFPIMLALFVSLTLLNETLEKVYNKNNQN
ncbi:MAG: MFS transporter [Defluviitaleaceae bacterium]|nr:MFS transporter [Defluviitaleaceae bacterium]